MFANFISNDYPEAPFTMTTHMNIVGPAAAGKTLPPRCVLSLNETADSVMQVALYLSLPPNERGKELFIFMFARMGLLAGSVLGSRVGPLGRKVGGMLGSKLGACLAKLLYACYSRLLPKTVRALPPAPVVIDC